MKTSLRLLPLAVAFLAPGLTDAQAQSTILAGYYTAVDPNAPDAGIVREPNLSELGFTSSWAGGHPLRWNDYYGSTDGTYGDGPYALPTNLATPTDLDGAFSFVGPVSSAGGPGDFGPTNHYPGTIVPSYFDWTLTNNTGFAYVLGNLLLDGVSSPNEFAPRISSILTVSIAGNTVSSWTIPLTSQALIWNDMYPGVFESARPEDFGGTSFDLSAYTVADGESITIRLAVTDNWVVFDNLAITGTALPIPEPSGVLLLGLTGTFSLVRRRRSTSV